MSDFKLESDLAAAEICGHDAMCCDSSDSLVQLNRNKAHVRIKTGIDSDSWFSLSSPSDRDATVQALGDKFKIGICATGGDSALWFLWDEINQKHLNNSLYPTYKEAIRHAVVAVGGELMIKTTLLYVLPSLEIVWSERFVELTIGWLLWHKTWTIWEQT